MVALRAVAFACGAEARGRDRVLQLKHRLPRRDEGSSVREGYPEVDWIRLHVDACMCAIIKGHSGCFREGRVPIKICPFSIAPFSPPRVWRDATAAGSLGSWLNTSDPWASTMTIGTLRFSSRRYAIP